jgi:hypothetical protein
MHAPFQMSVSEDGVVHLLRILASSLDVYILLVSMANLSQFGVEFLYVC